MRESCVIHGRVQELTDSGGLNKHRKLHYLISLRLLTNATTKATYQTTSDEKHGDGYVLEILRAELIASVAEVLEEDISGSVGENESAFDEFRRRSPFLGALLGTDVPRLHTTLALATRILS